MDGIYTIFRRPVYEVPELPELQTADGLDQYRWDGIDFCINGDEAATLQTAADHGDCIYAGAGALALYFDVAYLPGPVGREAWLVWERPRTTWTSVILCRYLPDGLDADALQLLYTAQAAWWTYDDGDADVAEYEADLEKIFKEIIRGGLEK